MVFSIITKGSQESQLSSEGNTSYFWWVREANIHALAYFGCFALFLYINEFLFIVSPSLHTIHYDMLASFPSKLLSTLKVCHPRWLGSYLFCWWKCVHWLPCHGHSPPSPAAAHPSAFLRIKWHGPGCIQGATLENSFDVGPYDTQWLNPSFCYLTKCQMC